MAKGNKVDKITTYMNALNHPSLQKKGLLIQTSKYGLSSSNPTGKFETSGATHTGMHTVR